MKRPTEDDLFAEEQAMPAMSFGDHIEELRTHLILALLGLFAGVVLAFVPIPFAGVTPGQWVFNRMQAPAQEALDAFYKQQTARREAAAKAARLQTKPFEVEVRASDLAGAIARLMPEAKLAPPEALGDQTITLPLVYKQADWIQGVQSYAAPKAAVISLGPLEGFMIYFMVCLITGLVISSPWVFYQLWTFVAAGLYRHERHYVMKSLPFSLGLFLGGVLLCFFFVLPFTLRFLLDFNGWLNIEPNLRISEWMGFATMLPLIFGICFQTPLVMLVLERIGIFTIDDFKSKRRYAILVIVIAAAAITPTGDPMTMMLLAGPMYGLYELGIQLMSLRARREASTPAVP
jgi:sec-independent protein translocase protein TatC